MGGCCLGVEDVTVRCCLGVWAGGGVGGEVWRGVERTWFCGLSIPTKRVNKTNANVV